MESGKAIDLFYGPSKDDPGSPVDIGPEVQDRREENYFIDSEGVHHLLNKGYSTGPPIDPGLLSTIDFAHLPPDYYTFSFIDFKRYEFRMVSEWHVLTSIVK